MNEHPQCVILRQLWPGLSQNRFVAQDSSVAVFYLLKYHRPTEASLPGIEPGQLVFVEAFPHTGYQ